MIFLALLFLAALANGDSVYYYNASPLRFSVPTTYIASYAPMFRTAAVVSNEVPAVSVENNAAPVADQNTASAPNQVPAVYTVPQTVYSPTVYVGDDDDRLIATPYGVVQVDDDDDDRLIATPYGVVQVDDNDDDRLIATPYGVMRVDDDDDDRLIATPYGVMRVDDDHDDAKVIVSGVRPSVYRFPVAPRSGAQPTVYGVPVIHDFDDDFDDAFDLYDRK